MTQDEIIAMAREAGMELTINQHGNQQFRCFFREIERFADLVEARATEKANARANASWTLMCEKMVAIEREECAKVCDRFQERDVGMQPAECAAAIRQRG